MSQVPCLPQQPELPSQVERLPVVSLASASQSRVLMVPVIVMVLVLLMNQVPQVQPEPEPGSFLEPAPVPSDVLAQLFAVRRRH